MKKLSLRSARALVFVILATVGIGAAVALVQYSQDLRQQASIEVSYNSVNQGSCGGASVGATRCSAGVEQVCRSIGWTATGAVCGTADKGDEAAKPAPPGPETPLPSGTKTCYYGTSNNCISTAVPVTKSCPSGTSESRPAECQKTLITPKPTSTPTVTPKATPTPTITPKPTPKPTPTPATGTGTGGSSGLTAGPAGNTGPTAPTKISCWGPAPSCTASTYTDRSTCPSGTSSSRPTGCASDSQPIITKTPTTTKDTTPCTGSGCLADVTTFEGDPSKVLDPNAVIGTPGPDGNGIFSTNPDSNVGTARRVTPPPQVTGTGQTTGPGVIEATIPTAQTISPAAAAAAIQTFTTNVNNALAGSFLGSWLGLGTSPATVAEEGNQLADTRDALLNSRMSLPAAQQRYELLCNDPSQTKTEDCLALAATINQVETESQYVSPQTTAVNDASLNALRDGFNNGNVDLAVFQAAVNTRCSATSGQLSSSDLACTKAQQELKDGLRNGATPPNPVTSVAGWVAGLFSNESNYTPLIDEVETTTGIEVQVSSNIPKHDQQAATTALNTVALMATSLQQPPLVSGQNSLQVILNPTTPVSDYNHDTGQATISMNDCRPHYLNDFLACGNVQYDTARTLISQNLYSSVKAPNLCNTTNCSAVQAFAQASSLDGVQFASEEQPLATVTGDDDMRYDQTLTTAEMAFVQSGATYMLNPELLAQDQPHVYEFFRDHMYQGNEFVQVQSEDCDSYEIVNRSTISDAEAKSRVENCR